ncbi:hypothetical protein RUM44_006104 [Polyplax serrata]|uniref:G kinase-anchoring protein 1 n=1 Tax=Polyplax serrata TaxID=468196 RepID=A0ABR1AZN6_POLSC
MANIVASRFAVLCVDDDDDDDDTLYCTKKKKSQNKKVAVKCQDAVLAKPEPVQKKKKKQDNNQVQNVKKSNKQSSITDPKKKKKVTNTEQWEEWKERDDQFVQGNFEEELSKAILLSKLDYEKKKEYESVIPARPEKPVNDKKKKKSQKVMSLDEFNNLNTKTNVDSGKSKSPKTEKAKENSEFFESLEKDIKKEISKANAPAKKKLNDSTSQEALTLVLYQASLDKKDREIDQLKEEIERLNMQLINVKTRNTKLCQIIASGEMKDKAEVLMEVERLQTIKDELSTEVASLHTQLEQERSKVRQLTAENKNKSKKYQNQ